MTLIKKILKIERRFYSSNTHNSYSKNQFKYIHFSLDNFNSENFKIQLLKNFKLNTTYSILIKLSSHGNLIFKMCGPQIGIVVTETHNLEFYEDLFSVILTRIESIVESYQYVGEVNAIEIMYTVIKAQPELLLKNISNLTLSKHSLKLKEVKNYFNHNLLPLTTNTTYYGRPLLDKERIKYSQLIYNSNDIIKKNELKINESDKLFLYQASEKKTSVIILSKMIDTTTYLRQIFDFKTGLFITVIKDIINTDTNIQDKLNPELNIQDKESNIIFNRTINSVTLTIKNQKIIQIKIDNKLNSISSDNRFTKIGRNPNFGTFDLETFVDSDGLAKVYALGFFTNIDKHVNLFYLTDYTEKLEHDQLILKCINTMLSQKYHNFIFYTHNFGKFDFIFLYNVLLRTNQEKGYEFYKLNTIIRDDVIIKLDIKVNSKNQIDNIKVKNNKKIKISIVDSLNLLNNSLEKLAIDFKVVNQKGKFPYSFVNRGNLNYIGEMPNKSHYKNISDKDYNNLYKKDWNLKQESLTYLEADLKSLLSVMNEFSSKLYIYFNTQMTEALTITRLALNIFLKKFYKTKELPLINKVTMFNFISAGYFGGITEVYIPHGINLIYIDVNSLYPFAALNPFCGTEAIYLEALDNQSLDLNNLFGFFYAKVRTNGQYLGLLPVQTKNNLIFPEGEYFGIWSSEELLFARSKGYEVTVIKGYNFNKIHNTFKEYILELFKMKATSVGSIKMIAKSLLNNLLGRFGLNMIKPITQTVNKKRRDFIASTRKIHSQKIITPENFLITYDPIVSKEICEQHGLDYITVIDKEYNSNIEKNIDLFKDISITTAAMTTSYARIYMNQIKLEILSNGGKIYYSDTDSLVIDKTYLNPKWLGTKLGQFKLEYQIEEAYFISNKTYCLILKNGETVIKAKGVINNSLTVEDFKSLYWNKNNVTATKVNTITNYEKGSVLIENKNVTLNYDSYTKREKIYNEKGIWIDTKPLFFKKTKT